MHSQPIPMTREQAENLVYRRAAEDRRGMYPNGFRYITLTTSNLDALRTVTERMRDEDERMPLYRFSDDEIRALLPEEQQQRFAAHV